MFLEPKFLTWNFWTFVTLFAYFPLILTKFFGVERIATNIFLSKRPSVVSFLLFNTFFYETAEKRVEKWRVEKWVIFISESFELKSIKKTMTHLNYFTGAGTILLGQTQLYWGRHSFTGADTTLLGQTQF